MKNLKIGLILFGAFISLTTNATEPTDGRVDIWPSIPFIRGADLCRYKDAYGQTRSEYMSKMIGHATNLMYAGARGKEALSLLVAFNQMYDLNLDMANRYNYLDVTLESTLKAYISGYYRDLRPRVQKISFTNVNDILALVRAASNGQRDGYLDPKLLAKLDYVAYGTYALAPNCQGDIQVTLHLVGRDGDEKSYLGNGKPEYVMSQIASKVFEDFQRTQFPSKIKVGTRTLTLVGGLNGSVDTAPTPQIAKESCATLDARLPEANELELISAYGDWSGGVSLGNAVWALPSGKVFAPTLRNPSPIREKWEVNATEFKYYCVRD